MYSHTVTVQSGQYGPNQLHGAGVAHNSTGGYNLPCVAFRFTGCKIIKTIPAPPAPAVLLLRALPTWLTGNPRFSHREVYGGEVGICRDFITQYEVTFELQPSAFPTERAKVAYVLSLFRDENIKNAKNVERENIK